MQSSQFGRVRVAVAGASGFIGTALCQALAEDLDVLALTRSPARARAPALDPRIRWRHCDLFSIQDLTAALSGCEQAVYLVHSLAPSSRLTQASARDLDLILADNFARAAAANGIRQIVCVGSLLPTDFRIAPLLWSRREVELVLAARGIPLAALRAGLVVGPGGSATRLLVELVRRLPLLWLPASARARAWPLALADLVRAIRLCLAHPEQYRGVFDLGGPDALSYEAMLRETAAMLGVRRWISARGWLPLSVATALAQRLGGAPATLIGPALESLGQDIQPRDNPLQQAIAETAMSFREALRAALDPANGQPRPNPRQPLQGLDRETMQQAKRVRSVQRIILPPGEDAAWVAGHYFRWLGSCCWPLVRTTGEATDGWTVSLVLPRLRLLRLQRHAESSDAQRQVYRITGGLLSRPDGLGTARFEFQTLLENRYTMAAIHDYAPALPWPLYRWTQAVAHLLVMRLYQRQLARLSR